MKKKKRGRIAVYCRVSTLDQVKGIKSQEHALKQFCINHNLTGRVWYRDKMSGGTTDRPAFNRLQKAIFAGEVDTVVCWKLDRLSRSLKDGVSVLCSWLEKEVRIISITQQLDFNKATGQMVMALLFAVAAMERENLRENVKRGLIAAKARGVKLGKRPKLFAKSIVPLLEDGYTVIEAAKELGVTRQAVYDCLERENVSVHK